MLLNTIIIFQYKIIEIFSFAVMLAPAYRLWKTLFAKTKLLF